MSMLGVTGFFPRAKNVRKCEEDFYLNASNLIIFMSNIYRYVPIQISNAAEDSSFFKVIGTVNTNSVILRKNYIWDTLDIDWCHIKGLLDNKDISLPIVITILIIHKYRIRRIMNKPTLRFLEMIMKGNTWFSLTLEK